jgi:hypothetical protein
MEPTRRLTAGQGNWRKSSYSGAQNACVELTATLDRVRDSKNPAGPVLRVALGPLFAQVKAGRFG